jgi:hypothetical protein
MTEWLTRRIADLRKDAPAVRCAHIRQLSVLPLEKGSHSGPFVHQLVDRFSTQ